MNNIMSFGKFNVNDNSSSEIEWIILDVDANGNKILLSKDCLFYDLYHNERDFEGNIKWETSSVRKWLNNVFFNQVFTDEDKTFIIKNIKIDDYVFLLSKDEVEFYLKDKSKRITKLSLEAKKGKKISLKNSNCSWYLREPSEYFTGNWTAVNANGEIDLYGGDFISSGNHGIRPAIIIKN